jgi:hypothetical protein
MTIFSDSRSGWRRARAAILVLASGVALGGPAVAAPFVPRDADAVLERLPRRVGPEWEAVRALHAQRAANPDDAGVAARLAQSYLALNRGIGDPRLIAYARQALARWDGVAAPPVDVALERASIAQSEHRFDEARDELARLVARAPRSPQAWLTLAFVDTVQGRYTHAKRACGRLMWLQDVVISGACFATVQLATGDAASAYRFLAQSLARHESLEPESVAWLAALAAEAAEALRLDDDAARHYAAAVAASDERPSIYLLTAYADFLLRRGQPAAVIELLEQVPPADPILLRLALAESRVGRADAARLETLRYRLELALRGDDAAHAREAAFFALYLERDAQAALRLALVNWTAQREPIDARLVIEAAAAAGLPAAADPVHDWLASNGVVPSALVTSHEEGIRP